MCNSTRPLSCPPLYFRSFGADLPDNAKVSSLSFTLKTTNVSGVFISNVFAVSADSDGPLSLALLPPSSSECTADQVWSATNVSIDASVVNLDGFGFKLKLNDTKTSNSAVLEILCAAVTVAYSMPGRIQARATARRRTELVNILMYDFASQSSR